MRKIWMLSLVFAVVISTVVSAVQIDLSKAKIVVLSPNKKILANAGDMVSDEIDTRTRIGLEVVSRIPGGKEVAIVIGTAEELARESYRPPAGAAVPGKADAYSVWVDTSKRSAPTICAAGHDDRGTLFAAGRVLRLVETGRDKVSIDSNTKIATAPSFALRGHQLGYRPKTNSYDAWDLKMWEQYYREMVIFGMNAIELIPPKSDDDDDSPHLPKPKLEMMILMSQLAADYGLDVWVWWPAIEDDYEDPKTLAAELKEWGDIYQKLPKLDVVFVPGGDPGDTHPTTLFKFLEKQKKSLVKYHPKAELWMSPQGFDRRRKGHRKGWMKIFLDILKNEKPKWFDGVVFGPQITLSLTQLREEVPAMYPIRRYPDITHCRSSQYQIRDWDPACEGTVGREPINPRPLAYAKIFRDPKRYALGETGRGKTPTNPRPDEDTNIYIDPVKYSIGFITYSEGCNDDFNKVLWSCLGWDPAMDVRDITVEYSKYFISPRYAEKFADGLFGLEQNWAGPLKDNDGVYKTLAIFQEMEKNATPQEKLNWRFQQGLYRAYYDAYVKARLHSETEQEEQARAILAKAGQIGSIKAVDQAEAILDRADNDRARPEWRARAYELAEALYQSIRMQLSVKKYQAIRTNRGANLDEIEKPLNDRRDMKRGFRRIRSFSTEEQRLTAITNLLND